MTQDISVVPGDVLAGKYEIEQVLGAGGMGVVVAARHLQLHERVAIKFLLPEALRNPEIVSRFEREARAAVKIKSEHVARVIDVGRLETGAPYMVMEHLDGLDLGEALKQVKAFSVQQAAEYVLQACVALAEAHSLGIVHRDLKPANLFCVRRADGQPLVKVLDFGISKSQLGASDSLAGVTKTMTVMGSPSYMSPEQMQSAKSVDARTDIWALGVILYELVGGRVPFAGDTYAEICIKVATVEPEPLSVVRPDVPAAFEAVVTRCMMKARDLRVADVGQLAVLLAPFVSTQARGLVDRIVGTVGKGAGVSSNPLAAPPPGLATDTAASWAELAEPTKKSSSSRKWAAVAGGLGVVAGIGGVLVIVGAKQSAPPSVPTAVVRATREADAPTIDPVHVSPTSAPEPAPAARAVNVAPKEVRPTVSEPAPSPKIAPPANGPVVAGRGQAPPPPNTRPPTTVVPYEAVAPPVHAIAAPVPPVTAVSETKAPANDWCSPNFYYDATGKKVFKKECFK